MSKTVLCSMQVSQLKLLPTPQAAIGHGVEQVHSDIFVFLSLQS